MGKPQVKTKQRVADHGEVFTNEREVKAMLDLVKDQCQRIEATFLEPACGDGNFLIEILNRKLDLVSRYKRNAYEYSKSLTIAVSSLYGVELLEDNAQACRERLYNKIKQRFPKSLKASNEYKEVMKSIRFILQKNIICGNALDYTQTDGSTIVFYEWKFINKTDVKIRCFDFEVVVEDAIDQELPLLFSDTNEAVNIPEHNQEFKPIHFLKLYSYAK